MISAAEQIIKREIEFMFGRRIVSSRDCNQLSEEIFRITKSQLNPNTLRRFFGLVKTNYSPSNSTLQILSNYCGFISFEDVVNIHREKNGEPDSVEQKILLNYLVNLFIETPVGFEKNEAFTSVVKQTILYLNQHPALIEKFQSQVAKTKLGQKYYFEDFVYIDRLNSFYGNGLRYYLAEKNEPMAQIFGHSLLVFRYWLTEEDLNLELHFQKATIFESNISGDIDGAGRYFACLIYYSNASGISNRNAIGSIHNYYSSLKEINSIELISFETVIAEALILTGIYEEGLFYTNMAMKKIQNSDTIEESALQQLYLLHAIALCKSGDSKNSVDMYKRIRPSSFHFLCKKMQTILYWFLTRELKIKNVRPVENPGALIAETGFIRLRNL